MSQEEILITSDEAEEIVKANSGVAQMARTPLLVIVGIIMVAVFTLIVMIILSLKGVKTGLGTMPGFANAENNSLQLPSD